MKTYIVNFFNLDNIITTYRLHLTLQIETQRLNFTDNAQPRIDAQLRSDVIEEEEEEGAAEIKKGDVEAADTAAVAAE